MKGYKYYYADKIIKTGNPTRKGLEECTLTQAEAKEKLGFDPSKPLVLSVGGSLGARTVNEAIAASLDALSAKDVSLLWQTGRYGADHFGKVAEGYPLVKATTFITDMDVAYKAADIVVSRAGAGTISELQNLGKAVILIPSPNVAEDHQRHNAEALSTRGAAVMILDVDAVEKLPGALMELLDSPAEREKLSRNISEMALRGADEKIVDQIEQIIRK